MEPGWDSLAAFANFKTPKTYNSLQSVSVYEEFLALHRI